MLRVSSQSQAQQDGDWSKSSLRPDCFISRDILTAQHTGRAQVGVQGREAGKEDTGKGFTSEKMLSQELLGCSLFNPTATEHCLSLEWKWSTVELGAFLPFWEVVSWCRGLTHQPEL